MPAADSRCPMFDFTDPIMIDLLLFLLFVKKFPRAFDSIGSPTWVPVPEKKRRECICELYHVPNHTLTTKGKPS